MKPKRAKATRRRSRNPAPQPAAPGAPLPLPPAKPRRWLRRTLWSGALVALLGISLVAASDYAATAAAHGRLYEAADDVPARAVALVFGCNEKIGTRDNLYFTFRIDAAVAIWEAGKVKTLIVSGDNRSRFYNEPQKMKNALVSRGIPAERIVCDFAGLSTLDSVVRAKEIFGVSEVIFVTQKFHNERAIFLAKAHGVDAIGINARGVGGQAATRMRLRELAARVKMTFDVVLGTRPVHLGEREQLPD
jgi:SanA protein